MIDVDIYGGIHVLTFYFHVLKEGGKLQGNVKAI